VVVLFIFAITLKCGSSLYIRVLETKKSYIESRVILKVVKTIYIFKKKLVRDFVYNNNNQFLRLLLI
jgi:hypothetical protein